MTTSARTPDRQLPPHPDLDQLKRQAKELLEAYCAGDVHAAAEVRAHYHGANPGTFALHDAQLVLARAYGLGSWPKLKAFVDGVTVARLAEAVRANDLDHVRSMIDRRPELVHMDMAESNEHRALHYAVLNRLPEMVRLLMERDSDARKGIWPHRDATSALTIATERGYSEIVGIIREEEQRRQEHRAARSGGVSTGPGQAERVDGRADNANELNVWSAVAQGRTDWLRTQHAAGARWNDLVLLSQAVTSGRLDVLAVLLDCGLDPDERGRSPVVEEPLYSWGEPLRQCAIAHRHDMAELLLARGADPNTNVYAASTAMFIAYESDDRPMVALLERYGGIVDAYIAGSFGLIDRAMQMLADEAAGHLHARVVWPGGTVAAALLQAGADAGRPDIVRLAVDHLEWPTGDQRWHWSLLRPLGGHAEPDRDRFAACFRLMVERSGANVFGPYGRTILHDVCGAWPRGSTSSTDERVVLATILLDAGAHLNVRDDLLMSTPLGWACRWGRAGIVQLLIERGADPVEADAEPWATPRAWAEKMNHRTVLALLLSGGAR